MTEQELAEIERRFEHASEDGRWLGTYSGDVEIMPQDVRVLIEEIKSLRLALLGKSETLKFVSGGSITFMPDDGTEH